MATTKRQATRHKSGRFCRVEVTVCEGRLSITGTAGRVIRRAAARRQAREYWVSFFEECPEALVEMNQRCGTRFSSATGAAKYVLTHDGEFHGLDVIHDGGEKGLVYVGECFGQIREEIAEFFPAVAPYFRWHLNDMHAECEHQEAAGMTYQAFPDHQCWWCGWKLGHGWQRRELPPEVLAWATTFGEDDHA